MCGPVDHGDIDAGFRNPKLIVDRRTARGMGLLAPKLGRGWLVPYLLVGIAVAYGVLAALDLGLALPVADIPVSTLVATALLACYGYLLVRAGERFEQRRLEVWASRTITRLFRLVLLVYAAVAAVVVALGWIGLPAHPAVTAADLLLPFTDVSPTAGSAAGDRYALDAVVFVVLAVGLRLGAELDRRLWRLAGALYAEDADAEPVGVWERYWAWRRNRNR